MIIYLLFNGLNVMINKYLYALISLSLLISLSGCALPTCPDCGHLMPNLQAGDQFRSLQILPDYHYYYSGEILEPDAIIGIHQDYVLKKGFWTEIQLTEKQLKDWMWSFSTVDGTYDPDDRMTISYEGALIISPEGKQVGIYYSKYHDTFIRFSGNNSLNIFKPQAPLNSSMFRLRDDD